MKKFTLILLICLSLSTQCHAGDGSFRDIAWKSIQGSFIGMGTIAFGLNQKDGCLVMLALAGIKEYVYDASKGYGPNINDVFWRVFGTYLYYEGFAFQLSEKEKKILLSWEF